MGRGTDGSGWGSGGAIGRGISRAGGRERYGAQHPDRGGRGGPGDAGRGRQRDRRGEVPEPKRLRRRRRRRRRRQAPAAQACRASHGRRLQLDGARGRHHSGSRAGWPPAAIRQERDRRVRAASRRSRGRVEPGEAASGSERHNAMVKVPRFGRLRIPPRITQRWRARLRAQRRWWRDRWRASAGSDVLFPAAGAGMVAVDTLSQGASGNGQPRIAILHATAGSGHKRAAQALAHAFSSMSPGVTVREVDTLVYASRLYRGAYAASYNAMAARAPRLWGVLYHSWALAPAHPVTTPPSRGIGHRVTEMRLALDRLNLRRLVRVCERE